MWTLEHGNGNHHYVRTYTLNSDRSSSKPSGSDVVFPVSAKLSNSEALMNARLAHDGKASILLAEKQTSAVHLLAVNGTYIRQLLYASNFTKNTKPLMVAVDDKNNLMYVAQTRGIVRVFTMTYE